jgi:hypothetical protein
MVSEAFLLRAADGLKYYDFEDGTGGAVEKGDNVTVPTLPCIPKLQHGPSLNEPP